MAQNQPYRALLVVGLALAACNTPPPKEPGDDNAFGSPAPTASAEEPKKHDAESSDEQPPPAVVDEKKGLTPDQRKQMEDVLRRSGDKAAQCPASTGIEDAPRGKGEVTVTFDGQKGKITEAVVGPPWAGTPIESCIKRSFVNEFILPFEGPALEVPYTIELPAKKDAAPAATTAKPKKGGK